MPKEVSKSTTEESRPIEPMPEIKTSLLDGAKPKDLMKKDQEQFAVINQELRSMRIELSDTPNIESLINLYAAHVKGRAYYERAEELYRTYLSYASTVNLFVDQAAESLIRETDKVTLWVKRNKEEDYKQIKTAEERKKYVLRFLPESLTDDDFYWKALQSQVKTNLAVLKSYKEQFKFGCFDSIQLQQKIINTLMAVGNIHVDPEALRVMQVIENSYKPTETDKREKAEDYVTPEFTVEDGKVQL